MHAGSGSRVVVKMNMQRGIILFAAALLVTVAPDPNIAAEGDSLRDQHRAAVELARAGNTEAALEMISDLRAENPSHLPLLYDETVILSWAEQHDLVLYNAVLIDPDRAPSYVVGAIAKSARAQQQFDTAVEWYESALLAEPDNLDARFGLVMSLADDGQLDLARKTLDVLPAAERSKADALMASAYLYERDRAFIPAINNYDAVLEIEPERRDALRAKALALKQILLPHQALELEKQYPGLLTPRELTRAEADALALDLRDAIEVPEQKYSFVHINMALNNIDDRLAEEDPDSELARSLRYDRIVGLVHAARMDKAIQYYEELLSAGDIGSSYVHYAAGRAYLIKQRPQDAEVALRRGEALDPYDRLIQLELFYALVELERLDEALAIPDKMAARFDATNQVPGSAVAQPNRIRMQAEIMAGSGRAYAEELGEAEQRLAGLVAAAPNNQDARSALGNVYSWRGWKERAESEYNQVLTINPDQVDTKTSRAQNAMDMQKYPRTEAELYEARAEYVTQESVWDLNKRWIVHNYSQLVIESRWGESSGQTFGNEQYDINAWWFTKPIKYNYRLYARTFDSWAEFPQGDHSRRRAAVGTEFRKGPWLASGEFNFDRSGFDEPGFAGRVDHRLSDTWFVGGEVELNSYATPLRADHADIESNLFAVDTTFRRHESWNVSGGLFYQDFDDGNDIIGLNADTRLRIYDRFTYMLDGYASFRGSKSSKEDAVYFNPERGLEVLVGVDNFWRQFRLYDKVLRHRFGANAGIYDQKNFGSDHIWTLEYDLNWDINEQLAIRVGWQRSRRVYDGGPEYSTYWLFGFNGWF